MVCVTTARRHVTRGVARVSGTPSHVREGLAGVNRTLSRVNRGKGVCKSKAGPRKAGSLPCKRASK
ncbi:MAG: hypothetical protein QOD03_878 [Verrucomicrobiota bacterium]|jgi:hypothetical protein